MRHVTADAFWDFSLRTGIMRGVNMRIHRAAFRLHLNILFDKRFVGAVTLETEHLSKLKYETDVIVESHPEYFINRTEEE